VFRLREERLVVAAVGVLAVIVGMLAWRDSRRLRDASSGAWLTDTPS
jgi:hypothetical protein